MKKVPTQIRKQIVLLMAAMFISGMIYPQNTTITDVSSHTADASAVLDVHSTSLGMLVPRLGSNPSSPATGLLYYNTGSNSFLYNAGTSGSPSWTELSYGKLWSRTGTDTWLTNQNDNVVIGTNTNPSGYKFYVFGGPGTLSRFDGQVEFWNVAGGVMDADINDDGSGNGVLNVYSQGSVKARLESSGSSFFTGGNVGIGTMAPLTLLHISDNVGVNPQLQVDNLATSGDASIGLYFFRSVAKNYSFGIYDDAVNQTDYNFKICNSQILTGPGYSDPNTMMEIHDENQKAGIIDFNHQSRARVFQTQNLSLPDPGFPNYGQLIPPSTWTMVNFDQASYDEHTEWNLAANPFTPTSYFTATETGYYQVNSRIDFGSEAFMVEGGDFIIYEGPISNLNPAVLTPSGYVSIAIYVNTGSGFVMYAQGNKLQGVFVITPSGDEQFYILENNLAPNVSDVLELNAGDQVAIYVWHSLTLMPYYIPLRVEEQNGAGGFPTQCYVSIHKVS